MSITVMSKCPILFRHYYAPRPFGCGDGWRGIIAALTTQIEDYLIATYDGCNDEDIPALLSIKEKFGVLNVYLCPTDDYLEDLIGRAEWASCVVCELCGAPGEIQCYPNQEARWTWLVCRCEKCFKER